MHIHSQHTALVKKLADELGFNDCGIASVTFLEKEFIQLKEWIGKKYHGDMKYMERNLEMRTNPELIFPGAKSVICFALNYYPKKKQESNKYLIAKYAYGKDYHKVIKKKLKLFIKNIKKEIPHFQGRGFVDSAPVMERQWAQKAGLGWIGKNSLLIKKTTGSFFFLATIITNVELDIDYSVTDHCGTCTACIDACPTAAIVQPYVIDSKKCISYLTIEKKELLTPEEKKQTGNWLFGCDICQDVCPWNSFSRPTHENAFDPESDWLHWQEAEWSVLSEIDFNKAFRYSPLKRAGHEKIRRWVTDK